jgi:hypothetical protein
MENNIFIALFKFFILKIKKIMVKILLTFFKSPNIQLTKILKFSSEIINFKNFYLKIEIMEYKNILRKLKFIFKQTKADFF